MARTYLLISLLLVTAACTTTKSRNDLSEPRSTDGGFRYTLPHGEGWLVGQSTDGLIVVGRKSGGGTGTEMAMVRHGPITTPAGQAMTNADILKGFRRDLERDAVGGRVRDVRNVFKSVSFKGAECLWFRQNGVDPKDSGPLLMKNAGRICLHPRRPYQFLWLALSERRPQASPEDPDFETELNQFLDSVEFI